jgi:hypothetical protein
MKKIDVPLILQDDNSADCGPICVQMVLKHFNKEIDVESLKSQLTYTDAGTSAYDNGMLLLSQGLKVTAITAHPYLFPLETIKKVKTNDDLLQIIEARSVERPKEKIVLDTFKNYIEMGGEVTLEIPTFEHIQNAIDTDKVVIALFFGSPLGFHEGGFHFVVVNGYNKEGEVFITNPLKDSKKQAWFPVKEFLFALHSSTLIDIDNGTLLVVSQQKKL